MKKTALAAVWMLSCPVKEWTGMDCPGCGFQRSFWALAQGDVGACWEHYPPMFPFLFTIGMVVVAVKTRWRHRMVVLWGSLALTCIFILVNFVFKPYH
jgi:hypothetical protein